jgi:plastocyanin
MYLKARVLLVVTILFPLINAGGELWAAEFMVTVNGSNFSPSNRTINQGDRITWVWGGSGSHTTTHVPAQGQPVLWNQTISSTNQEYTRTFNTPGTFNYKCTPHGFTGVITVNSTSGILDEPGTDAALPGRFDLRQNSPNPFNAATQIEFGLERDGIVQLMVYNILGQHVATLVDGFQPAGFHTVLWDGRDGSGREAPSGIYFARMLTADVMMTRKMVLLR